MGERARGVCVCVWVPERVFQQGLCRWAVHVTGASHTPACIVAFQTLMPVVVSLSPSPSPPRPLQDLSTAVGSSQTPAEETAAAPAAAAAAPESVLSGSHRHIAELLLEQIEVADVLLLNKADTVSEQELQLLQVRVGAWVGGWVDGRVGG